MHIADQFTACQGVHSPTGWQVWCGPFKRVAAGMTEDRAKSLAMDLNQTVWSHQERAERENSR